MITEDGFPEIINGNCDGLGCGHAQSPCWCDEFHAMKMNFQRHNNKAWDCNDPICKAWEDSFRVTDRRWRLIVEQAETEFCGKKIVGGLSNFFFALSRATQKLKEVKKL